MGQQGICFLCVYCLDSGVEREQESFQATWWVNEYLGNFKDCVNRRKCSWRVCGTLCFPKLATTFLLPLGSHNFAIPASRDGVYVPSHWNSVGPCDCIEEQNAAEVTLCDFLAWVKKGLAASVSLALGTHLWGSEPASLRLPCCKEAQASSCRVVTWRGLEINKEITGERPSQFPATSASCLSPAAAAPGSILKATSQQTPRQNP